MKKKKHHKTAKLPQTFIQSLSLFPPPFFALTLKRRMTFFQINQHLLAGRIVEKARETENRSERETEKERECALRNVQVCLLFH